MAYETDVACTVLIVGAGPTGLTLALELARRKVPFRLIDAAPSPFTGSRGKGLQPRTLEILERLGVIDEVRNAGALYPRLRLHLGPLSWRAGSLGSAHPATLERPHPNLWMVPQGRTEEILRARLEALGGRVEFGVSLTAFVQAEQEVRATLSTDEVVACSWLVGCDGGRSTVRKSLGLRLHGATIEEKPMFVGDVEVEGLSRADWHVWPLARGGAATLCPLPATEAFQLTGGEVIEREGVEAFVKRTTGYRVRNVAWQSIYRPQVRMVEHYRVGRVFLAGDAAHLHPPSGGQGLNTGVQDAWNLGWKLAWVARGGPESVLDTYEEERLPIAAAVLDLSKTLHVKRSLKRGALTNQLGLHYRGSSLSSGEAVGTLHPGDRFLRTDDGTGAIELVRDDGLCVLVRPDGYVAKISRTATREYAGEPVTTGRCAPAA